MRVAEAWEALVAEMEDHAPECLGLDLFTQDDLTPADVRVCAAICAPCPLYAACKTYRRIGRPTAGVWAGKRAMGRAGREVT